MSTAKKRLISIILIVATLFGVLSVGAVSASAASAMVSTTDAVRLRSSAKIASDNIITTLNVNEQLTLLSDSADGWANVRRSNGTTGYCSVDYLQPVDDKVVKLAGVVVDGPVNFRSGPSTDYTSIKMLDDATAFVVVDNTNEFWVKATVGSTTGYIYRTYTALTLTILETGPDINKNPNWFDSSALEDMIGGNFQVEDSHPLVKSIDLSDENVTLEAGSTYTVMAYIPGGTSVQGSVTFNTSNKNIATVTKSGVIKGVTPGTAVITAKVESTNASATCKVTVVEATTTAPTEPETTAPTEPEVTTKPTEPVEDVKLSASSASVAVGNHYKITANRSVTWSSSNTSVATVSDGVVTGKAKGTATITATSGTSKAQCKITVTAASSGITISKSSVSVTEGKSYYNSASPSSGTTWSSSDTSIATVSNGFITAVSKGKAVITAKNSSGTKTCLVTVTDAEPIRFAYSEPNTAAPGEQISLCAVTDKTRTAVKFEVTVGSSVKTVNATTKATDGNTYVWTATTTISTSGTHNVVAYSKQSGGWQTCSSSVSDAKTTVFVRNSSSLSSDTMEYRRGTDKCIDLISQFEGYSPCVYFDTLANNIPTLGYGRVVYVGESFYNDMTKREAYAYLVRTVNNDGYTSTLNNYLDNYKISRNQQQFDSLLSFCYNLGPYIFSGDSDFKDIFTASTAATSGNSSSGKDAYINGSDVNLRSGPGTSYTSLGLLSYGTSLVLIETSPSNNWYHVKTKNGTEGYVYADYVTKGTASSGGYSLSKINKSDFVKLVLQYHHAGSTCVWGLLYRRVDELDVFYYGDYVRNGSSNKYDYNFTCKVNSSTTI